MADIPEGRIFDWEIRCYSVSAEEVAVTNRRLEEIGWPFRQEAGCYLGLFNANRFIMGTSPVELWTLIEPMKNAQGHVLLAGLGLGILARALAEQDKVTSITVVELSQEVISMVEPYTRHRKIKVVQGDIFKYSPAMHFDYALIDIWNRITPSNLSEMNILEGKLQPYCSSIGFLAKSECVKNINKSIGGDN